LVVFITIIVVAVSSFFVVLRATLDSNGEVVLTDLQSGGLVDDAIQIGYVQGIEYYRFLISWLIEVAASLFVWYPILGTILFSGVLGCYRLPFLGGRPRDILVEEWEREKRSAVASLGEP
jgi:apolipoprotein N-acyltransferase